MMKRLFFLLTALLTLSVGMWAETLTVSYDYPVYNTPNDPKSGIASWQTGNVEAIVVESSLNDVVVWGATGQTTWYVVTGENVTLSKGAVCNGAVHLILADGALLSVAGGDHQAGIQVSGEDNSLSIYGQAAQSGRLIATGGESAAGIGGGDHGSGSNITINGGTVSANGGNYGGAGIGGGDHGSGSNITINGGTVSANGGNYGGAGIGGGMYGSGSDITINGGMVTAIGRTGAAGIGGGMYGSGSNITINGGTVSATGGVYAAGIGGGNSSIGSDITINGGMVTATGGVYAAGIGGGNQGSGSNITINSGTVTAIGEYSSGIGGGYYGSGSDIFMPVNYRIKADGSFIHNNGTDLAGSLAGKQNVEAYPDGFLNERNAAFAAINAAVEGFSDETILAVAAAGMEDVFQAKGSGDIEASKQKALSDLQYVISIYNSGKAAGKTEAAAELLGSMGEPCTDCPAVEVTKDTTTIRLYNPEKVEFKKME